MNTDHLVIESNDRKFKLKGNMIIQTEKGSVLFSNNIATVMMNRSREGIHVIVNGEGPFLVSKYHVSYHSYPTVRNALGNNGHRQPDRWMNEVPSIIKPHKSER